MQRDQQRAVRGLHDGEMEVDVGVDEAVRRRASRIARVQRTRHPLVIAAVACTAAKRAIAGSKNRRARWNSRMPGSVARKAHGA